ncbi:MAG: valine--tRNA ligase [Alphaproteobacteria bacterium]
MLEKTFRPAEVEAKHYDKWEKSGAFAAQPDSGRTPFTIVIPPPNVTGSLHMGHALNNTLQDALIRYKRMKGFDPLWMPGTDHAGIATQMVVERQLAAKGIGLARGAAAKEPTNEKLLDRKAFLDKVWEWKAESGGTITRQLRRLGASLDWSRERFTMDEGLSKAVLKVFVDLYNEGLIYKDKRLVNWDPKFLTAISDLEVEQREVKGHLWHINYPIDGMPGAFITVATTRPETLLGDTGVAVHPTDERWGHLIGKFAVLPLVGRKIPIVADEYSDPEKGTGAVKITPAHDFNDFEVGKRHNLEAINVFTAEAQINANAPEAYRGLDRFDARKKILAELEEQGLLVKTEPHPHVVPHGDRSGVPVEPYLTEQWYVDAKKLAGPAIAAVEDGRTQFVPKQWEKTYFHWMTNIEPWCISRQLWWGHQIPAWYGPDDKVFVAYDEAQAQAAADKHYGKAVELRRDPDVLDTWFSSGLWAFSTLGWPDNAKEVERYYPTDVLVTGFDIIFFWVARMMMLSLHFMKDVPFRTVYVHALVRDEKGQKMSKSKGNVIDPLDLIDKYGADALRFTLVAMAAQGRDIKLAESRVEGYRNFATKIWNAARFNEMNGCALTADYDPASAKQVVNRWIVSRLAETVGQVETAIDGYKFNEAAGALYQFAWGAYCDWYLEFAKPLFQGADEAAKAETRATSAWVLGRILHLLHPFMPFLTEELWDNLTDGKGGSLISAEWPRPDATWHAPEALAEMDWVVRLIEAVRGVRSEMNVPPAAKIALSLKGASETTLKRLATHKSLILTLARLETAEPLVGEVPKGAIQFVVDEATVVLPIAGLIDVAQEQARLKKEIAKVDGEIAKVLAKLGNEAFVSKAPPEIIEENRERQASFETAKAKLTEALTRLSAA